MDEMASLNVETFQDEGPKEQGKKEANYNIVAVGSNLRRAEHIKIPNQSSLLRLPRNAFSALPCTT